MIVKNESPVITRCLASVKEIIDYWVIVDTGSTDGTQEIIRQFMKDIPGELHERPWVNFSENRNQALELAKIKGDYILFIDADEQLSITEPFDRNHLDKDCYYCILHHDNLLDHHSVALVHTRCDWKWVGVLHEGILSPDAKTTELLSSIKKIGSLRQGARSLDPKKYEKDAAILETALKEDPLNSRYVFYLAESYVNGGNYLMALKNYEKRAHMEGWDEEVFWSLYCIGQIQEILGMAQQTVIQSYNKAFSFRPTRLEPLFRLTLIYLKEENYLQAYLLAKEAIQIPLPNDALFVEKRKYDYLMHYIFAECAFRMGRIDEAKEALEKVLKTPDLPEEIRNSALNNLNLIRTRR